VGTLLGKPPAKAKEKLGCTPKITFKELVTEMEEAPKDNLCKNPLFQYLQLQ
jgi:GDP-D-mannose dehydratase